MTAVRTNINLNRTTNRLDEAVYRLSSGYKINHSKDDPAGYAILRRMNEQLKGVSQANVNAADGISIINTGEGALNEVQLMLKRMNELAVQAASETNTMQDRENIQQEIEQLKDEINRISESTAYNGRLLFNGETERTSYISNASDTLSSNVAVLSQSATVSPGEYQFRVTKDPVKAEVSFNLVPGTLTINEEQLEITQEEISDGSAYEKIQFVCEGSEIKMEHTGTTINLTANQAGSKNEIHVQNGSTNIKKAGEDVEAALTVSENGFSKNAVLSTEGNVITVTDMNGFEMRIETESGAKAEGALTMNVLDSGTMQVQIGSESENMLELVFEKVSSKTLGVEDINVCTTAGASKAISLTKEASDKISKIRSRLGAYENRLNYAIDNLETQEYNVSEATSRIGDTDMAEEMTTYTELNVLQQATSTILSKTNQRAETIMQLLQA